ncbi:hypothetical protein KQX54_018947 [Cotesia glomerata]|uniref:Uncharacterized protein n=1 Tax=Cotesia glomerata TaxID=32391 RepID=A0AAV7IAV6_COTGL|nr:hypothetical protein KQX54_018947 [Cotesia glomerata]
MSLPIARFLNESPDRCLSHILTSIARMIVYHQAGPAGSRVLQRRPENITAVLRKVILTKTLVLASFLSPSTGGSRPHFEVQGAQASVRASKLETTRIEEKSPSSRERLPFRAAFQKRGRENSRENISNWGKSSYLLPSRLISCLTFSLTLDATLSN